MLLMVRACFLCRNRDNIQIQKKNNIVQRALEKKLYSLSSLKSPLTITVFLNCNFWEALKTCLRIAVGKSFSSNLHLLTYFTLLTFNYLVGA